MTETYTTVCITCGNRKISGAQNRFTEMSTKEKVRLTAIELARVINIDNRNTFIRFLDNEDAEEILSQDQLQLLTMYEGLIDMRDDVENIYLCLGINRLCCKRHLLVRPLINSYAQHAPPQHSNITYADNATNRVYTPSGDGFEESSNF